MHNEHTTLQQPGQIQHFRVRLCFWINMKWITQSAYHLDDFEQVNKKHVLTWKRKPYPYLT